MSTNTTMEDIKAAAEQAMEVEAQAQADPERGAYTHTLLRPFQWEGKTYEKLTFQWDALTGADHLEIEFEMLGQGRTLVVPAFTGEYLCGMAVRACEEWRKLPLPVRKSAMKALSLKDFSAICGKARNFLLRSESLPETEDNGSGSDA